MERKKRSKGSVWEFCYANKIFGTFEEEMKAYGQKWVTFCTHTHTRAAKLVVRMLKSNTISTKYYYLYISHQCRNDDYIISTQLKITCR